MTDRVKSTAAQTWVLLLSAVASFMVILDMLVVATALSAIQTDLGASLEELEWTVNAYTLSFAVFLMTGAALGDRYGRRRMFAAGLAIFGLASAACALAPNVATLVAARAVQGTGAALIMPLALTLLNAAFPPERRGWATGVFGSVTGLAAMLGPVVGGLVTEGLSWPWIFWLNVPIAIIAVVLVLSRLPESRGPAGRVDLLGLVLAAGSALGLTWGLVRANSVGWTAAETVVALAAGVVLGVAFVAWELRTPAPMLPLRLFRSRAFSSGNAVIFFVNAAMTAAIFFTAQLPQVAFGEGPLVAGLRLLPWGVAPFLIAPRAGVLADRIGERPLILIGSGLLTLGTAVLALVSRVNTGYVVTVGPMVVAGIGFSLAIPAVTKAVVSSVAMQDIGRASGTFSTLRQLGGAFGVAIAAAVFASTGGYAGPDVFVDGYRFAIGSAAALALAALLVSLPLPRKVKRTTNEGADRLAATADK
ncbi:EmrB/QacA subfamily drug resistance transporter [Kribbella voronezhensis]|uniref:EmrB/QacA subfamily drug resistance transporter n=1 Tax=Kribbella voronezhensis TaxID=2512212 RepID=A0A4R7T994_9ACTN|nr:DHA2 family efflux MFS transporter permease subunit [Kribbella voronezhensis]TDU87926.1 EmrB/QacA subfamily drug resistance transporter [Kribbella voronezhensis]